MSPVLFVAAFATVPDLYGLGARSAGAGGGGVALVDDGTAAYLNPAGLHRIRRPRAGIGFSYARHRFDELPGFWWDTNRDGVVDANDAPLEVPASPPPASGLHIEAGRHVGGRFGLGLTAYVPTNNLVLFEMFEPSLPHYPMYANRLQRFVASAGIGGELVRGVAVGASLDLLARAQVDTVATVRARVVGPDPDSEVPAELVDEVVVDVHRLAIAVKPQFAPVVGVQILPGRWVPALEGLTLGASYHAAAAFDLNARVDLQADLRLEEFGSTEPYVAAAVLQAQLAMIDHYVPPRLTFGAAYSRQDTLSVYAEGRFTDWRKLVLNVARLTEVDIDAPLFDIDEAFSDGNAYGLLVRPSWAGRAGVELHLPRWEFDSPLKYLRLTARGGFGYETTPFVEQGETTALLDGDRLSITLGAGVEFWDPLGWSDGAVRFDAFFQSHSIGRRLLERSSDTPRAGFPVGVSAIPSGGNTLVGGAQWSFDY